MKIIPLAVLFLLVNCNLSFAPQNIGEVIIIKSKPQIEKLSPKNTDWGKEVNRWKYDLGFSESSNKWDVCNKYGYMGKYQFHQTTLESLGYFGITPELFRSNPNIFPPTLQEKALEDLMKHNNAILKNYIGRTIGNIQITKSGLLAAAHLAGVGGVIDFFENNKNYKDANGTSVATYLKKFQNYNI
jgi:hypothetical protein